MNHLAAALPPGPDNSSLDASPAPHGGAPERDSAPGRPPEPLERRRAS